MDFSNDKFEFDLRNEESILLAIKKLVKKSDDDDLDNLPEFVEKLYYNIRMTPLEWGDDVFVDMNSHFDEGPTLLYTVEALRRYFKSDGQQDGLDKYDSVEDWLAEDHQFYRCIYQVVDNSYVEAIIKRALVDSIYHQLLEG